MNLTPGLKLRSATSAAQVIVIRGAGNLDLTLAGSPVSATEEGLPAGTSGTGDALLIGKRYADASDTVELLCTLPGAGPLALAGEVLNERAAKALPSSD